jgi:hypothetical protein
MWFGKFEEKALSSTFVHHHAVIHNGNIQERESD